MGIFIQIATLMIVQQLFHLASCETICSPSRPVRNSAGQASDHRTDELQPKYSSSLDTDPSEEGNPGPLNISKFTLVGVGAIFGVLVIGLWGGTLKRGNGNLFKQC